MVDIEEVATVNAKAITNIDLAKALICNYHLGTSNSLNIPNS